MTGNTQAISESEDAANSVESGDNGDSAIPRGGLGALEAVADELNLSGVAEQTARSIYREAVKAGVHEGRRLERIGVASVPLAARVHTTPIALGVATDAVRKRVPEAEIKRRRQLSGVLRVVADATGTNLPPTSAERYIASVVEGVEMGADGNADLNGFEDVGGAITGARNVLDAATGEQGRRGYSPPGVAAGAVFRIAEERDESVTETQIAEAAGVSRPTVYKHARRFSDSVT